MKLHTYQWLISNCKSVICTNVRTGKLFYPISIRKVTTTYCFLIKYVYDRCIFSKTFSLKNPRIRIITEWQKVVWNKKCDILWIARIAAFYTIRKDCKYNGFIESTDEQFWNTRLKFSKTDRHFEYGEIIASNSLNGNKRWV